MGRGLSIEYMGLERDGRKKCARCGELNDRKAHYCAKCGQKFVRKFMTFQNPSRRDYALRLKREREGW